MVKYLPSKTHIQVLHYIWVQVINPLHLNRWAWLVGQYQIQVPKFNPRQHNNLKSCFTYLQIELQFCPTIFPLNQGQKIYKQKEPQFSLSNYTPFITEIFLIYFLIRKKKHQIMFSIQYYPLLFRLLESLGSSYDQRKISLISLLLYYKYTL